MSYEVLGPENDAITPTSIIHSVDEIRSDGEIEQKYNFLDYRFERDGFTARARSYLDDIETVSLLLEPQPVGPDGERFATDVKAYLAWRFAEVEVTAP